MVASMPQLNKLEIAISSNKIGSEGFAYLVGKLKLVRGLTDFTLKCDDNKIGV